MAKPELSETVLDLIRQDVLPQSFKRLQEPAAYKRARRESFSRRALCKLRRGRLLRAACSGSRAAAWRFAGRHAGEAGSRS